MANMVCTEFKQIVTYLDWNAICQKYIGVDGDCRLVKEWKRKSWTFYQKFAIIHLDSISPIQLKRRAVKCWTPWTPIEFCQCDNTTLSIHFKSHYNPSHAKFVQWLQPLTCTEFMMWSRGPVDLVAKREWPTGAPWDLPTTITNEYTGHETKLSRARLPLEGLVQALVSFKPFFISILEPTRIMIMEIHALRVIDCS